jgi:hypothetical protein
VTVNAGTDVTGHITVEGDAKLAGSAIYFNDQKNPDDIAALIRDDNTFATGLYADRYNIYLGDLKSKLIIKSIRSEGIDVYQEGITIFDAGKAALEIVLAPEGGQGDGVILDQDDKPVAGATVLLIAEPKFRARGDSFHPYTTDQYGRYHFENVRPGEYKVFAWDDIEPDAWFDPVFLKDFERRGEPVTVTANSHETVQRIAAMSAR